MEENATNKLGSAPVGKLLLELAIPAITAQLINMLYNIIDRIYIGHIQDVGPLALTGVGLTFPIIMIISAFSALIGMGGSPLASMRLGEKRYKMAEKIVGNCFSALLIIAVTLTIVFLIFARPLLYLFGASDDTIDFALSYMNIYIMGTVFVMIALGMNPFISAQGFAKTGMLTVTIGAVFNIALDPLFIFAFGLGVPGAALATIISQAVSCFWVLKFLTGKKTTVKIRRQYMRLDKKCILPVLGLGLSPFIMQSTESLLNICFNSSLQKYGGDLAVGAMTIMSSLAQVAFMPLLGLAQGAQPIISYNFGANNKERVRKTFRLLIISSVIFSSAFCLFNELFPNVFVSLFANSEELQSIAAWALRIYMAGAFMMGIQDGCQQTFIALGQAKTSIFLALFRKMILLIPLIYILPNFFTDKVFAVFLAEPVADIVAATTTGCLFAIQFKRLLSGMKPDSTEAAASVNN